MHLIIASMISTAYRAGRRRRDPDLPVHQTKHPGGIADTDT
ncbi:MAG: hypothetical protein V3T05_09345 [Myxococcota bacterium]